MLPIVKEINTKVEKAFLKPPRDLDRLKTRKGAKGSNLTICVYVQGDTNNAAYYLYTLYSMAKAHKGDLETLKDLASSYISFIGVRFHDYYGMVDSEILSMRTALEVSKVDNYDDYAEIVCAIQHYYSLIAYWIDMIIPWAPLSKLHNEILGVNELKDPLSL